MENIITIQTSDSEFIETVKDIRDAAVTPLNTKSFDGMAELTSLVITVTPLIVRELSKIIVAQINAKKSIKVVKGGTEISGLSKDEIIEVLNSISK
ncbi:hypothetical protein [Paraglaciecola sp.]|uniref:hypothetical protein n=1 Tax=Paraglaciecola sp. TaxID=1920173 RepID=UPI0030F49926